MSKQDSLLNSQLKVCSVCGKQFYKAPKTIYKIRKAKTGILEYQCCYTCYMKAKEIRYGKTERE